MSDSLTWIHLDTLVWLKSTLHTYTFSVLRFLLWSHFDLFIYTQFQFQSVHKLYLYIQSSTDWWSKWEKSLIPTSDNSFIESLFSHKILFLSFDLSCNAANRFLLIIFILRVSPSGHYYMHKLQITRFIFWARHTTCTYYKWLFFLATRNRIITRYNFFNGK